MCGIAGIIGKAASDDELQKVIQNVLVNPVKLTREKGVLMEILSDIFVQLLCRSYIDKNVIFI